MSARALSSLMLTDLITTSPGATFREVALLMREKKTNGVVVIDASRKVVGIVSSQNLIKHVIPEYMRNKGFLAAFDAPKVFADRVKSVQNDPVSSFMNKHVRTVWVGASYIEAAAVLAEVRQLPVVDDRGALVGYLTRTHLKNAIGDILAGDA